MVDIEPRQRDIRKWLMKAHDKGNGNASQPATTSAEKKPPPAELTTETPGIKFEDWGKKIWGTWMANRPLLLCEKVYGIELKGVEETLHEVQEGSGRRKTSKYFAVNKQRPKEDNEAEELPAKRKTKNDGDQSEKPRPSKKVHKADDDEEDDDFALPNKKNDATSSKKLKSGSGRGVASKSVDVNESDDDDGKDTESPLKSGGRGRGGRGASGASAGGRGRGGGRGGFMNFGERKDPPHKGEKVNRDWDLSDSINYNHLERLTVSLPCDLTIRILNLHHVDSLEREEAEDLIKRHGGRITGSSYLLCDEDIEGRKSAKAKELGTPFLTEDGLFNMIRSSKNSKAPAPEDSKVSVEKVVASLPKKSPQNVDSKSNSVMSNVHSKGFAAGAKQAKQKDQTMDRLSLTWTEKYRPKVPNEIIGNQSLVTQLHNWLKNWNEQFLDTGNKGKGKKQNDSSSKKAVLLSGTPGIGKTTSAKLVNASDSRGKADAKIFKGIGGSNANCIKELINNEALGFNMDRSKHPKTVLIMDEVDGMSAGDRGGVADLIASIKISKVPIICICNDRYSQKLKSLVNYCLLLSFRKPTKQQWPLALLKPALCTPEILAGTLDWNLNYMHTFRIIRMAKRLMQVANAEGLQVNEIALEELAERVHGDMRMALNQLQYMSLCKSVINYDDVRQRLQGSGKDEDISPFSAVDKLFGFNGGKLRMDERIDLSMSDPDLVPLLIQSLNLDAIILEGSVTLGSKEKLVFCENYINYRPSSIGKDDNGMKRMSLIARAAESIADGDIINVQIRRYRQWQLSQTGSLSSCIIPAALLHGSRETLEQGERNFNRFGGWLGKNSTRGKNLRLLEDLHVHLLASGESNLGRETLRLDYLTVLLKQLADPLRVLPKDEAVEKVVEFMNVYSISQEDMDTIVELSKFQGHGNPLDGIPSTVKAALTRAYKEGSKLRMVRAADLVTLPGMKKVPKKRIAAILEPSDEGLREGNGDPLAESEGENSSDPEDTEGTGNAEKLKSELQSLNSKGVQVEVELKGKANSNSKKTPTGRGKQGSASAERKPAGRGRGGSGSSEKAGAKRKR
ncbi:unnamed protein product [Dovyalis caffra]|uniref:Replication factor C subunit 1 n=1 Tax=Dovyalis caffra TaxID=77055 RepID=A0AAV1RDM8_9ROSI|nr:unnamed protein product [Dovyalis caffra]